MSLKVVVVIVAGSIASLKVALTLALRETAVAPLTGVLERTVGGSEIPPVEVPPLVAAAPPVVLFPPVVLPPPVAAALPIVVMPPVNLPLLDELTLPVEVPPSVELDGWDDPQAAATRSSRRAACVTESFDRFFIVAPWASVVVSVVIVAAVVVSATAWPPCAAEHPSGRLYGAQTARPTNG